MADGELGFEIEFGHGAVEGGKVEERIVAEAAGASGRFEDETFHGAFRDVEGMAVARGDQNAAVAGGAVRGRDAGKAIELTQGGLRHVPISEPREPQGDLTGA